MWKTILDKYFLSFVVKSQVYEIFVTDYISLWTATYSEKDFVDQLKKSNEGLLLENEKQYIENGLHLLNIDFEKLKHTKIVENGESLLMILRVVTEYPFRFKCELSKCSNEYFFEKVTQPLLKTISELKSSQDELIQLLTKKDKEIKAYKRELDNRKIIFPHEETKQFNDREHQKAFTTYAENFGTSNIPNSLLKKSLKLTQKTLTQDPPIASIKQESNSMIQGSHSIKQEPATMIQGPHNIEQEPDSIKQESNVINKEANIIKQELSTPVFEDHTEPLLTQSLSCKQEITKPESSQRRINDRRKKLKLNY